jgi:hypothetical protein
MILDVMTLDPRHSPYFTVNTAASKVSILNPVYDPIEYPVMINPGGLKTFTRGDNFQILSVGYILPENFVMASFPADTLSLKIPRILFGLQEISSYTVHYIPEMSAASGVGLPMENFESGCSIFVNAKSVYDGPFKLFAKFVLDADTPDYPQVSMQGVPAALEASKQLVTVFAKILHNFVLAA